MEQGKVVLAKTDGQTLDEHISCALKVLKEIMKNYPELPHLVGVQEFYEHLFATVVLHDLGKATKWQDSPYTWNYRHEIVSGAFAGYLNITDSYKKAIILTVCGHHRNLQFLKSEYGTTGSLGQDGKVRLLEKVAELENYREYLIQVWNKIQSWEMYCFGEKKEIFLPLDNGWEKLLDPFSEGITPYLLGLDLDEVDTLLTGLYGFCLKGFLLTCDHLASGGNLQIPNLNESFKKHFSFSLRDIQFKAASIRGDMLLSAPTGFGKTEAALLWAENNLNKAQGNRIFYILPFTASINAMYKRLTKYYGQEKIGILHGKSTYFIYKELLEQGGEEENSQLTAKENRLLTKQIYYPIKIITPYQLLKTFFSFPGYEQSLAELVNGVFIVDEIHAYAPRMTALIILMLKYIKEKCYGKILIMTATMPSFLKQELVKELDINCKNIIKPDESQLKLIKRHRIKVLDGKWIDYTLEIKKYLEKGKKVLVICNSVNQAISAYDHLRFYADKTLLLHGRMNTKHREKNEKLISDVQLLVSTQVVEVSLDIDFDILFSEPAPLDSLLQRFGRVNRKGEKQIGEIYIFLENVAAKNIYNWNRTKKTLEVLKKVEYLSEDLVETLLNEVYCHGYNEEELAEYNITYRSFKRIIGDLVPHLYDRNTHLRFDELFNAYMLVPSNLEEEYLDLLEKKLYLEASSLEVPVYKWHYAYLHQHKKIISKVRNINGRKFFYNLVDINYSDIYGLVIN